MQKQDNSVKEVIKIEQARKDLQKIVGLPVSRAWKGYGTISFLELGELHLKHLKEPKGYRSTEKGDWTLGHLWNWKIIRKNTVEFDSYLFSDVSGKVGATAKLEPVEKALEQLEGARIISIELNDDATVLSIALSNGTVFQTSRHKDVSDVDFFTLSYNHHPYLVFGEKNSIFYEDNEL